MFPAHYFAPRYFATRYFPNVGRTPIIYDVLELGAARAGAAGTAARLGVATSLAQAGAAAIEARTHLTEDGP